MSLIGIKEQKIMDDQILQAVIESLQTYPVVKVGNMVFLGIVNSILIHKGHPNIHFVKLLEQLSDYIQLGYFAMDGEKIKVTELGIVKLMLNP